MPGEDVRPTLELVEDDDAPAELTRGDWRGLWVQVELVQLSQVDFGKKLDEHRAAVKTIGADVEKLLVQSATISSKLSLVKLTREVGAVLGSLAALVTAGCVVAMTGRFMGWW